MSKDLFVGAKNGPIFYLANVLSVDSVRYDSTDERELYTHKFARFFVTTRAASGVRDITFSGEVDHVLSEHNRLAEALLEWMKDRDEALLEMLAEEEPASYVEYDSEDDSHDHH